MHNKLFSQKIHYLFEQLDLSQREFIKLFWDGSQQKWESRYKTVKESWLGKGIDKPKGFRFDEYPISKWNIGDTQALSEELFLDRSFDEFKEQVDRYIEHTKTKPKVNFEYRYVYFYDVNLKEVTYNEIVVLNQINDYTYDIELKPAPLYKSLDLESFIGQLRIDNNYYYIHVESNLKIIAMYFIANKGFMLNKKVHGVALSLSYHHTLPHALKHILSPHQLSKEEEDEIYLIANESEYLRVDANFEDLYKSKRDKHIKKLNRDIENLATYVKKSSEILQDEIEDDIYINLFQSKIMGLHAVSQKVALNHNYYQRNQRLMTKIFLETIAKQEDAECNIVYPTFEKEQSLFDENDKIAIEYLRLNINLAQNGLNLNRIFIVESREMMSEYCIKILREFIESGISVKIALKEDVDRLERVSSYDLVYDVKVDSDGIKKPNRYTMYRHRIEKRSIFKVSNTPEKLREMHNNFENINDISVGFEEFMNQVNRVKKNQVIDDKSFHHLLGSWYYSKYLSFKDENDQYQLSTRILTIENNGEVSYKSNNNLLCKGKITIPNTNQFYIELYAIESNRLFLIMIDKVDSHKDIFKVICTCKHFSYNSNMSILGILSKDELNQQTVKEALGDPQKLIYIEENNFTNRINELNINYQKRK